MLPAHPRARSRALAVVLATTGLLLPAALVATPAQAVVRLVSVPYAAPAWARAAADQGAASAATVVHFELGLDLQDDAAAAQFATDVSRPGSPDYRHFLTPADWIARFAPTQAVFDATVAQLHAAQLTVTGSPASREYLLGTATVGQLDTYFHTSIHRYSVRGRTHYAARTTPSVPAALGEHLASVDFDPPLHRSDAVPASKAAKGTCSSYYGQHTLRIPKAYGRSSASTVLCGYTPKQVRAIYGLDPKGLWHYWGHGQTIAVVGAYGAPSMRRDLATYSTRNGLPNATYREVVADPQRQDLCWPEGWQLEQALDLEAVHAVAPHAGLVYVGASDCFFGMDLALSTVLDAGLASIVSNSYGSLGEDPNSDRVMLHQHLQAAGEGIGLYFASGDYGDEADLMGEPSADFPATSPWVTTVGGTTSALDRHRKLVFSTGWGDNVDLIRNGSHPRYLAPLPGMFAGGAGGGVSTLFAAPAYQSGVVPTSLGGGMRVESDVAALASPATGFTIGFRPTGSSRYLSGVMGGTSLATPIVAAEVALAQQQAGHPLGFLNPALYGLVRSDATAVRDVAPSSRHRIMAVQQDDARMLVTLGRDTSLTVRKGYDEVTGVGELTGSSLARLARL